MPALLPASVGRPAAEPGQPQVQGSEDHPAAQAVRCIADRQLDGDWPADTETQGRDMGPAVRKGETVGGRRERRSGGSAERTAGRCLAPSAGGATAAVDPA